MYITANGRVLPCCIAPFSMKGYGAFTLGDATQSTLRDIWNGAEYQRFREGLLTSAPPARLQQLRPPLEPLTQRSCPPISIIIPALNEAESIGHVVASMPWHLIAECIVVDNGSTDATAAIAQQAGARVIQSPRGYGAACLAGSQRRSRHLHILVYMDGDGSDIIDDLPALTDPIASDAADFVIGSRIRGQREPGSMLASQVFAGYLVGTAAPPLPKAQLHRYGTLPRHPPQRHSNSYKCPNSPTAGISKCRSKPPSTNSASSKSPSTTARRIGGESKVSGNLTASLKAATRILEVLFRVGLSRST